MGMTQKNKEDTIVSEKLCVLGRHNHMDKWEVKGAWSSYTNYILQDPTPTGTSKDGLHLCSSNTVTNCHLSFHLINWMFFLSSMCMNSVPCVQVHMHRSTHACMHAHVHTGNNLSGPLSSMLSSPPHFQVPLVHLVLIIIINQEPHAGEIF